MSIEDMSEPAGSTIAPGTPKPPMLNKRQSTRYMEGDEDDEDFREDVDPTMCMSIGETDATCAADHRGVRRCWYNYMVACG